MNRLLKIAFASLIVFSAVAAQASVWTPHERVPDGGSTLLLLGGVTIALGFLRRFRRQ